MSITTTQYGHGTSLTSSHPWGMVIKARVMCSDGVVRPTVRVAETPDTFFSLPAAVRVKGKTVAGYITTETATGMSTATDDDPVVIKFIAYSYRKNGDMLPGLTWKKPTWNVGDKFTIIGGSDRVWTVSDISGVVNLPRAFGACSDNYGILDGEIHDDNGQVTDRKLVYTDNIRKVEA